MMFLIFSTEIIIDCTIFEGKILNTPYILNILDSYRNIEIKIYEKIKSN